VKVNKANRKLVAAGTAEDVEIAMELDTPTAEVAEEENTAADTTAKNSRSQKNVD